MKNKVLLSIELPPPMHGMTYVNQIIYQNLKDDDRYLFHLINRKDSLSDNEKFKFSKVFKNFILVFDFWKSFFKTRPSVVYLLLSGTKFGIIRDFLMYLPVVLMRKKMISHLHGFTHYKTYKNSLLYRVFFNIMTQNSKFIVLCDRQKETTKKLMNKESYVLNNCLNSDEIFTKNLNEDSLKLCYISNISYGKGTLDLVKAVKNKKNISLVVAGSFLDNKEEFLSIIQENQNIKFVGFADEDKKHELLKNSDIFCLPSKLEEGSPISIIEALRYGLPILATNKGCIAQMIQGAGYVLDDNYSEDDIIKGIEYIRKDYVILSQNAITYYEKYYSKKVFIENLNKLLGENVDV